MLDKFRSDYIVHFYGAVFIPNKICMVTEFAEYGSIQDLIKKQPNGIEMKMRIKLMLDCAKGIHYLHENGILHRDIKPDNFLVISLDSNVKVNAKLTDFGSSRNINMLITNISFTKGIGSPKYMAPEILNREHYKKPADVYSFAVTMLEILLWGDSFAGREFKFPWSIADFVVTGKRPRSIDQVENGQLRMVIEKSWCQKPQDRFTIGEIIEKLEEDIMELNLQSFFN